MLSILGEKLGWRKKKKTVTNPQVSSESLGSRTKATTTCEKASVPAPPTKGLLPSPLESF